MSLLRVPSMEICSRAAAIPELFLLPKPSYSLRLQRRRRCFASFGRPSSSGERDRTIESGGAAAMGLRVAAGAGLCSTKGGAGILERPTFDQPLFDPIPQPQTQEGGDIGRLFDRNRIGSGGSYRVLLIDDMRHTENQVEKVIPRVVPSVTVFGAREIFHESRRNGVAVVIVTVKEHAEFYSQTMVHWGLRSAIEPNSEGA